MVPGATKKQRAKAMLRRRILNCWQLYLFLFIPIVYILIFKYYPMTGIQIAFKKYDYRLGIWGSKWIGLEYFKRFINSYQFERVLSNTLRLSIYSLIAGFPLPILLALMLNAMPLKRYKKVVQTVSYMPHFISTVVMVGIIYRIFSVHTGAYGQFYKAITGETAPDLLGIANAFPHMYVWSGIWQGLGFNSIIYVAALSSVDTELHEAAEIDGANRFQRMLHIDLPTILPTATILLIMSCGSLMNQGFEKAYLMQNSMNLRTSELISTYVYKVGMVTGGGNFSFAAAVDLMNAVVNFTLLVIVNFGAKKLGGSSLW